MADEGYKALGKIGISYKGEYASNTAYERLDAVAHNGSTYLAIKDAPDGAPRDDKVNWIYLAKGFSGDIGDSEITFTEAETRENIDTGESVKSVFGKIKKWFNDMTVAAFAQVITSNEDLMALTRSGYLPDALAVKNQFDVINGKLSNISLNDYATGDGWLPTQKLNELSYTCVGRLIPSSAENIPDEYKTSWNAFVIALFGMGDKSKPHYPYNVGIQIITDMTGEHKTYKRVFCSNGGWSDWISD